jgi:hypothetical protein
MRVTLKTQNIFNTFAKNIIPLEFSQGVSPWPASWGLGRVAQKKHLSFVVVSWYAGDTKICQKVMIKANNCRVIWLRR